MPAALKVDWAGAKTLFIGGLDVEPIAEQLGISPKTLQKRVERGEWIKQRNELRKRVSSQYGSKEEEMSPTVAKVLSGTFQAWKESAINDVAQAGAEIARKLREETLKKDSTYDSQAAAFEQFEPAARVLKPFLGLNDNTNINVGVQIKAMSEVPDMGEFELPK